ncbi:hypothetical protein [Argonema galeatum]|uniref:hypothetical protein n=1 Tax=Argonema galeatum TaxID=2942762 RepID=UPI002013C062|nr:hypothetical protein [Argonema galeatum]MCL1468240.1 hypothetical protein [Argonema galeatum A003/A1]
MLDMIFYPANEQPPHYVELSEDISKWLAKSEFFKIGKSVTIKMVIDKEEEKLPLVKLSKDNRKKLRAFLLEAISQESDNILSQLGDSPSKQEYQDATYLLRKLQELRKCVENENYKYLQRVV